MLLYKNSLILARCCCDLDNPVSWIFMSLVMILAGVAAIICTYSWFRMKEADDKAKEALLVSRRDKRPVNRYCWRLFVLMDILVIMATTLAFSCLHSASFELAAALMLVTGVLGPIMFLDHFGWGCPNRVRPPEDEYTEDEAEEEKDERGNDKDDPSRRDEEEHKSPISTDSEHSEPSPAKLRRNTANEKNQFGSPPIVQLNKNPAVKTKLRDYFTSY